MVGARYGPVGPEYYVFGGVLQKKVNACCVASIVPLALHFNVRLGFIFITALKIILGTL